MFFCHLSERKVLYIQTFRSAFDITKTNYKIKDTLVIADPHPGQKQQTLKKINSTLGYERKTVIKNMNDQSGILPETAGSTIFRFGLKEMEP